MSLPGKTSVSSVFLKKKNSVCCTLATNAKSQISFLFRHSFECKMCRNRIIAMIMDETIAKREEDDSEQQLSAASLTVLKRFRCIYLIGRLLAAVGESLPKAYRYALLEDYGFQRSTIEVFSFIGYGSSLFLGNFSSAFADHYGRRLICFFAGVFYILYCILLNFSPLWIMVLASVCWGVHNAFYEVGFEAWLIQEHRDRRLHPSSLKGLLRDNSFGIAAMIAVGGFSAQLCVQIGGLKIPLIVSIVLWIVAIIFIWYFWTENYGSRETNMKNTFIIACRILRADPRIVLLGFAVTFFETASDVFLVEWTPALQQAHQNDSSKTLPLGMIFAFFNVFKIIGSLLFYPLVQRIRPQSYMIGLLFLSGMSWMFPIVAPNSLVLVITGFCLYRLCYGFLHPSFYLLRSLYIPDEVRATMMSYIRVPQLIFMMIILLGHFSLTTVLILCAGCNMCGALCTIALRGLKLPEEPAHITEAFILLGEPLSPSINTKQPQSETLATRSSIPQP